MSRWAVFLDRDGVVTEAPMTDGIAGSPLLAADLIILDGVSEALESLRMAGAALVLVTNQPDIARGNLDASEVSAMHDRLKRELTLDLVVMCPHSGHEDCSCRKPRPGMILEGAQRLDLALDRSWMVGDRWVDIAAGGAAGVATILVDRPYSWLPTSSGSPVDELQPDHRVTDLAEGADLILAARRG